MGDDKPVEANPSASPDDLRIGEIAVQKGFATQAQVNEALQMQRELATRHGVRKKLGECLLDKTIVTREQLQAMIEEQVRSTGTSGKRIGPFELLAKIGQGGMGTVFRARQVSMDRIVAVKVLPRALSKSDEFVKRFQREARAAGQLNHVNIVSAIDVGEADGYHYIAMEYVDGESLAKRLVREGSMKQEDALHIIIQVARGLMEAHSRGFVHRDVKPDNILLTKDNVAKVADLGLVKEADGGGQASLTQTGLAVGTPHYLSPEQARGDKDIDLRSDIYSLGATLYTMVCGRTPFDGGTAAVIMTKHLTEDPTDPQDVNQELSQGLCQAIKKMMSKDRSDRYVSCQEVLTDLELVMDGKPPQVALAGRGRVPASLRRTGKRQPVTGTGKRRPVTRQQPVEGEAAAAEAEVEGNKKRVWGAVAAVALLAVIGFALFGRGGKPDDGASKGAQRPADRPQDSPGDKTEGPARPIAQPDRAFADAVRQAGDRARALLDRGRYREAMLAVTDDLPPVLRTEAGRIAMQAAVDDVRRAARDKIEDLGIRIRASVNNRDRAGLDRLSGEITALDLAPMPKERLLQQVNDGIEGLRERQTETVARPQPEVQPVERPPAKAPERPPDVDAPAKAEKDYLASYLTGFLKSVQGRKYDEALAQTDKWEKGPATDSLRAYLVEDKALVDRFVKFEAAVKAKAEDLKGKKTAIGPSTGTIKEVTDEGVDLAAAGGGATLIRWGGLKGEDWIRLARTAGVPLSAADEEGLRLLFGNADKAAQAIFAMKDDGAAIYRRPAEALSGGADALAGRAILAQLKTMNAEASPDRVLALANRFRERCGDTPFGKQNADYVDKLAGDAAARLRELIEGQRRGQQITIIGGRSQISEVRNPGAWRWDEEMGGWTGPGGQLTTQRTFTDGVYTMEYRMPDGVMAFWCLRCDEDGRVFRIHLNSGDNGTVCGTGLLDNRGNQSPRRVVFRSNGWNTLEVRVRGREARISINGEEVNRVEDGVLSRQGAIGIDGGRIWIRRMDVRPNAARN